MNIKEKIKLFIKNHSEGIFNVIFILYFICGLLYISKHGETSLDILVFDIVCLGIYIVYLLFLRRKKNE